MKKLLYKFLRIFSIFCIQSIDVQSQDLSLYDSVDICYAKGMESFDAKDYQKAYDFFCSYTKLKPNDLDGFSNKLSCLRRMNKREESINVYRELINLNPVQKPYYESEIGKLISNGSMEEGKIYYRTKIDENPGKKEYVLKHADLCMKTGDRKAAIKDYIIIGQIEPNNITVKENIAVLAKMENDLQLEMIQYEDILKISPNHINSLYRLGCMEKEQKQYDLAIQKLTKVLLMNQEHIDARIRLGSSNFESGRKKEACIIWESAVDYGSMTAENLFNSFCR